jgi:membrane-anchored protein YejM (alkaline phosphatase superfamily)
MTRRQIWRWLGWFMTMNSGLCLLIGLRYLQDYPWPDTAAGLIYLPLAMTGHFALLAALPSVLLLGPLIAIYPMRRTVMAIAVFLAALAVTLLVFDSNLFIERQLHLSYLVAQLFETSTWVAAAAVLGVALLFEALLAGNLRRWLAHRPAPMGGRWFGWAFALCWLASQGLHIWGDAVANTAVTRLTTYLPLYHPRTAKRALARLGLLDPIRVQQSILARRTAGNDEGGELRYPLAPLDCARPAGAPMNVVWIVVDALRPDAVNVQLMPSLTGMRASSQVFDNHWSGGSASRMGAFAMFYGLPSTYFESFYDVQQPPVLLDEFRAQGYDLAAISATGFGSTTLSDRTIAVGIRTLRSTLELSPRQQNSAVTKEFENSLAAHAGSRPFLILLWYNPVISKSWPVAGLAPDDRYATNPRARDLWNHYRRGVHLVDREIARVLKALDAAGRATDTLVLVTSDHGYEFDDLGLGYYGNASNFGAPQLRSPLLLRWPGRAPKAYTHRTSHLDLPATLLKELFNCRNPATDYGMGRNLFDGVSWKWIIAGSYDAHAIVQPERVLVTHPSGLVEVLGSDLRPLADTTLDAELIEQALTEMRRFYR